MKKLELTEKEADRAREAFLLMISELDDARRTSMSLSIPTFYFDQKISHYRELLDKFSA